MNKYLKIILPVGVAVVAIFLVFQFVKYNGTEKDQKGIKTSVYEQISAEKAKELMDNEKSVIILDVRTPEEYAEGHIPDAVNVPNETIDSEMPEELPDKDALILVYCRSGNRSVQASEKLAEIGYTNIKEFGGINDWPYEITK